MTMIRQCFCFDFCFGKACGTIMFAVATGATISCSLGRQYGPVPSLSFLDIHVYMAHIYCEKTPKVFIEFNSGAKPFCQRVISSTDYLCSLQITNSPHDQLTKTILLNFLFKEGFEIFSLSLVCNQISPTEREGSVQLTSSYKLV
jgi:hypothetical protein